MTSNKKIQSLIYEVIHQIRIIINDVFQADLTGHCVGILWCTLRKMVNDLLRFLNIKHVSMCSPTHTHTGTHTGTHTTSALPIQFYLGGRATLGLIVSWSYCAAHLWRSHYKIHKLFKHVPALFTLSSHQLVQHYCLKSPSSLCSIDRIKQLLLIIKLHPAPKERRIETKR